MMSERDILALAAMEKLMKKYGAPRVSEDAKVALRAVLDSRAKEVCEQAVKVALHAGRKTVKKEDIELASK